MMEGQSPVPPVVAARRTVDASDPVSVTWIQPESVEPGVMALMLTLALPASWSPSRPSLTRRCCQGSRWWR